MKIRRLAKLSLAILSLQSVNPAFSSAQLLSEGQLPLEGASIYFYTDLEGDFAKLGELANRLYREFIIHQEGMPPFPVDISKLYQRLGLYDITGVSVASYPQAEGYFRNSSILHLNEGEPDGLWGLLNFEDLPFHAADEFSAKSDLVSQFRLNPRNLLNLVEAVAADLMGPFGQMVVHQQLAMQLSEDGLTLRDIILAFDQPISLAAFWPSSSLAYDPGIDSFVNAPAQIAFAARFPKAGEKIRPAIPYLQKLGAHVYDVDAITWVDFQISIGENASAIFGIDSVSGDLLVSSAAEDWAWFIEGEKLADNQTFVSLQSQLPDRAGLFSYTSPMLLQNQFEEHAGGDIALPPALADAFNEMVQPYFRESLGVTRLTQTGIRTDNLQPYSLKHQAWLVTFMLIRAAVEQNFLSVDSSIDYP